MTYWEEKMQKVTEGKVAEMDLSKMITEFIKAASGSDYYYGVKRGSLQMGDEGAGKFITGKISIGGDKFGTDYRDFKIFLDDLNDVDGAIKRREESKRLASRNIF